MRDYKFRAWDGKAMDYDYRDACLWNGLLVAEGDTILMQYTGLKDKTGKEIYEGDILKDEWVFYGQKVEVFEVFAVAFGKQEFADSNYREFCQGYNLNPEETGHYNVIGNIYENPELLPE